METMDDVTLRKVTGEMTSFCLDEHRKIYTNAEPLKTLSNNMLIEILWQGLWNKYPLSKRQITVDNRLPQRM